MHFLISNRQLDDDAGLIERMVTNDSFDYVMGLILALNAMIVGIQVDLVSREVSRWAIKELLNGY